VRGRVIALIIRSQRHLPQQLPSASRWRVLLVCAGTFAVAWRLEVGAAALAGSFVCPGAGLLRGKPAEYGAKGDTRSGGLSGVHYWSGML